MKRYYLLFLLLTTLFISACQEESPFVSKEVIDKIIEKNAPKSVEYVSFIMNQDIYLLHNFDDEAKRISYTPQEKKTSIKISHDHSKLVYLTAAGSPVIIDTTGVVLIQLAQYKGVKQMNWTKNDKTLYMLIGNKIQFYGSEISLPVITKEPEEEVISATINGDDDLLYILRYKTGINQFSERLVIKKQSGEEIIINKEMGETDAMKQVNISKDGNFFTVTYTNSVYSKEITQIHVYKQDEQYADFSWDTGQYFIDPIYDDYSKYIITATSPGWQESYHLSAIHTHTEAFEEDISKHKYTYTGDIGTIYVDWK